jgi:hypothetical protein
MGGGGAIWCLGRFSKVDDQGSLSTHYAPGIFLQYLWSSFGTGLIGRLHLGLPICLHNRNQSLPACCFLRRNFLLFSLQFDLRVHVSFPSWKILVPTYRTWSTGRRILVPVPLFSNKVPTVWPCFPRPSSVFTISWKNNKFAAIESELYYTGLLPVFSY